MAAAHVDSIRSLGPGAYTAEAVDAWASAVRPQMYLDAMAAGEVFFIAVAVAAAEPTVLGFASDRPDELQDGASVYVRGSAARQGLGSALWRLAEEHARARGAAAITVEASLVAESFYRRHGFEEISRGVAVLGNGAEMPCIVMRKRIAAA
jgi:GNAT superfamily N-acetyltransferase